MNNPDKEFEEFFAEIRKKDEQTLVPKFDELVGKKSRSGNLFIPLSIAASVLLLIGLAFYFNTNQKAVPERQAALEIILVNQKSENTQSLITNRSSIDEWRSPSDFLIDDFNEW